LSYKSSQGCGWLEYTCKNIDLGHQCMTGEAYVVFQNVYLKVRDPRLLLLRQRVTEPSVMILRATLLVRYLMRSSSVTRYVVKDVNISSKKRIQSGPLFGAPMKRASGDASKNTRML
jgi:hypothetical protein